MSLEGQKIDNYCFLRLLGSGGMGNVYLAEDARIDQQVAIKVIRTEGVMYADAPSEQDAFRLFQREAKAIAKLDHPHILPLFAYGEGRVGDTNLMYLVMPYRQEGSLASWLHQRGRTDLLSPEDISSFVLQAADALQHAHNRHVIHQDVKPANFLLRFRDGKVLPDLLLSDFGIARFSTASSSLSQAVRGTPIYMAPEQWEGESQAATDQYALAIMTYELLAGNPPFQGAPGRMMYQHITAEPQPPSAFNPHLHEQIDVVLLRALAKKPDQRFDCISAFATAFRDAVTARPLAPVPSQEERIVLASAQADETLPGEVPISLQEMPAGSTATILPPTEEPVVVPPSPEVDQASVFESDGGEAKPLGGHERDEAPVPTLDAFGPLGVPVLERELVTVPALAGTFDGQDVDELPALLTPRPPAFQRSTWQWSLLFIFLLLITNISFGTFTASMENRLPPKKVLSLRTTALDRAQSPVAVSPSTPSRGPSTPGASIPSSTGNQSGVPTPILSSSGNASGVPTPTPSSSGNASSVPTPTPTPTSLGGKWISPSDGFTITGTSLHFAAYAYGVIYVNFTVTVSGANSWFVGCKVSSPTSGTTDVYECDWNLKDGSGNTMQSGTSITVSFDVYDNAGNRILSADGFRYGTV